MNTQITLVATAFGGALAAAWLHKRGRWFLAYGTTVVAAIFAISLLLVSSPNEPEQHDITAVALAAGYVDFDTPFMATDVRIRQTQSRGLRPMSSLIGQLEDRLAADPGDPKGWTLLAQSYAFVGNRSGIESAISNAVLLGVDENMLRSQIAIVDAEHRHQPRN